MANEYPEILSKNYVNVDDTITVSSGASSASNIYDWNRDTAWTSVGSSDITTETIEVVFYEGSDTINRSFDRLIILDTNIKEFYLEYYDGSWHTITETQITDNAGANIHISFTAVTGGRCRLSVTKTITPGEEKHASELIVCLQQMQLSNINSMPWQRNITVDQNVKRIRNGNLKYNYIRQKYNETLRIGELTTTLRNELWDIFKSHTELIYMKSSSVLTVDYDIYQVVIAGDWREQYDSKIDSYTVELGLVEV